MGLRRVRRYGWKPDLPDARDLQYRASPVVLGNLPARVDLRDRCPKVYDQGDIGSCTANAVAAGYEFCLLARGIADFVPSRLFIYYNERAVEAQVLVDSGAQLRDGIKSLAAIGVCDEAEWPYDGTPADPYTLLFPAGSRAATQPPEPCYQSALDNLITSYRRLPRSLDQFRGCLAAGRPFVFGYSVYTSFSSDQVRDTGAVPMPQPDEDLVGGHAVLAVGYDDSAARFIVRNSRGDQWGDQGYFTLPYGYLMQRGLASDFWTISIDT